MWPHLILGGRTVRLYVLSTSTVRTRTYVRTGTGTFCIIWSESRNSQVEYPGAVFVLTLY